ncbi:MAG: tetratricopeptide repeat protein [Bacteroidota bacterium]|nr:tetratricopeptide repeat protein [Bacteroidota bacterium]MDP4245248.1 tetratricopeptide repeat protein [Bacteroidota bacterium]MDP4255848.1 tetratricopeptide repeat protein [Bacteroidota bacterium]MDP4260296.1 tetratricopeptide repeat protein [Bacteroidota bacterium]
MTKIIFLHVALFTAFSCMGQTAIQTDTLTKILQSHPAKDSNRVTPLLQLADAIIYTDPVGAMRYADEALDISEKEKWAKGIALSLRQKGNVYYVLSDNTAAMDSYIRALKVSQPLGIRRLDASLFNNLANIYSDLKQYDKALGNYREYLAASRELRSTKDETIALVNMGTVYTDMGDQEKALDAYRQALAIAEKDHNTNFIPIILNNIGVSYNKHGDSRQALSYLGQSIALSDKYGNKDSKAGSLNEIGKIYLTGGDLAHAKEYALQSLVTAKDLGSAEWQYNAWQTLYNVYERRHQYDSALLAYKNFVLFRDSVSNDEKRSALTRKELQFDFERKEASIRAENEKAAALADAEIRRQALVKWAAVIGALILLLAAFSGFMLYKKRRDADERRKEADLKARVSDTEMKVLRLQMNPHFIFNSLNSVSDYISRHETATANHFLIKFARMMRMVLENSEKSEITLASDLEVLELYMQLESMRLKNNFSYEIRVEPGIDKELTLVPPLMLQPFVENSIWHGIRGKTDGGRIQILIGRQDGMIHCIVQDNGVGRDQASRITNAGKRSMGLKITRDRIDIINQTKGANAGVDIIDLPEGTRVELTLPLEVND